MAADATTELLHEQLHRAHRDGVGDVADLPFCHRPAGATAAVLLVHGFAATPWEMRSLAGHLAGRGYACLAVRLPGHGTTPEDLAGRHWEEWLEVVINGHDLLGNLYPRVYGVGQSTGALLVLAAARQRQSKGVVLLSPYLRLQHRLAPLAGWLRYVCPYQRKPANGAAARHYYARRPLAGVHQINRLLRSLKPGLGEIKAPALAIHGTGDRTVDIDSGRQLVERLGSQVRVYERLGPEVPHVLTDSANPHRDVVFELTGTFLDDLERGMCRGVPLPEPAG
jgi:carboxylesterase